MRPPVPPLSSRHARALDAFVALWGEMASRWGVNRTMAQIHALLYGSDEPLDTDAIMARLDISRGNANMNLRALLAWGLVARVQRPGSRKHLFTAEQDVWELTARIIREREAREIRPLADQLDACRRLLTEGDGADEAEARLAGRLDSLIGFMHVVEGFSAALLPLLHRRDEGAVERLVSAARADGEA